MDTATTLLEEEQVVIRRHSFPEGGRLPVRPPFKTPDTIYTSGIKRIMDISIALTTFAFFLSWMIPILAILIRCTSKGSVFFIQDRVGLNGQIFRCMKFRTMKLNESSEVVQAHYDDQRVTTIGRFLRLTHIDELPQMYNVLMNDMSIVGPRPHMLYHDKLFSEAIPVYHYRHLVKPGITGLAQSRGFHGATPDFLSISNRTRLDLFYTARVSFLLDLKILLRTLFLLPINTFKK